MFSFEALTELFHCQITHVHKAYILKQKPPEILSHYWKLLPRSHYAVLLKNLLESAGKNEGIGSVMKNVDLVHLKMIGSKSEQLSKKILEILRQSGSDIKEMISKDINIYTYLFELAIQFSDEDLIVFLENYSNLFVQMRIASTTIDELEKLFGEKKPKYTEVISLIQDIPRDSMEVTLKMLVKKNWVTEKESEYIQKFFKEKKQMSNK